MMANYEMQLRSHIDAVKIAYNDYKNALIKWFDLTFITDDGSFACYEGLDVEVNNMKKIFDEKVALLQEFRIKHKENENV